ncbi:MAG: glutathione S-transferase family protein [Nannocystis sp.]|nr:glutathione S-transferase family protein [Nannocystis sp.]MBA3545929.1 glutathione S-transferase family protein [Nannocystis sp.]
MVTLYSTPLSANGRKALAVSLHLRIDPKVVVVNVYKGEGRANDYLTVNPQGKVPSLVDGSLMLWESNAILQYLAEAYGGYKLWSQDEKRRADLSRWLFWESSHWQPVLTNVMRPVVAQKLGLAPASPRAQADWTDAQFRSVAELLDIQLSDRPFIGGLELTIADFSIAGMMTYARACDFPFQTYPNIAKWYARIEALPAWQKTATMPWSGSDPA